jgi:hypothetical protein
MAYTKTQWSANTQFTTANLNNAETQFDEAKSVFDTHTHDDRYYTTTTMNSTFWHSGNDGHGSGMDADLLYHTSGNKHASDFVGAGVPTGLIIMWSGSINSIPSGWALCNGSNGTVDLRDRFVLGLGSGSPTTGGSNSVTPTGTATIASHALTINEIPAHTHTWYDYYNSAYSGGGTTFEGNHAQRRSGTLQAGQQDPLAAVKVTRTQEY